VRPYRLPQSYQWLKLGLLRSPFDRRPMLRLSKKTDYALISLAYVAALSGRPASAREIAERHDIPVELLAKVLQRLARRGVLTSVQGINGGYRLARPPQAISVADVVEAIDGPLTLTACSDTSDTCDQFAKCNIRDPLHRIRERIALALATCSVAELAGDRVAPSVAAGAPVRLMPSRRV
jgi:Rrf2 family protein